jgi:hypothetical protein
LRRQRGNGRCSVPLLDGRNGGLKIAVAGARKSAR